MASPEAKKINVIFIVKNANARGKHQADMGGGGGGGKGMMHYELKNFSVL